MNQLLLKIPKIKSEMINTLIASISIWDMGNINDYLYFRPIFGLLTASDFGASDLHL